MESHRHDLDRHQAQARQLTAHCDEPASLEVNDAAQHLEQSWTRAEKRLQDMIKASRDIVDHWRQFNHSYVHLLDRLGELEGRWYAIQRERFSTDIETLMDKTKVSDPHERPVKIPSRRYSPQDFQQRVEQMDSEINKMQERAKKLTKHLPSIASKTIDTHYSVVKHQYAELRAHQDKLLNDCTDLKHREKIYLEHLHELTQAMSQTHTALKSLQIDDEHENFRQLNDLRSSLRAKHGLIERLNSNEFLLDFKRAKQLHEAVTEYFHLLDVVQNRLKQLETNQYSRADFEQRCEKWNGYIQAIEQSLAVIDTNLPTNYAGLLEIDGNLSNTINDFNQRQQELIQIIREGQQCIDKKLLRDPQTFTKLEQRWQSIVKASVDKQHEVKELLRLWLSYQNQLESKLTSEKHRRTGKRSCSLRLLSFTQE